MSAFDDEFGLFGEEAETETERRSQLPARRIAAGQPPQPERRRERPRRERDRRPRARPADPWALPRRATDLLEFLAKRLVAKPDDVRVELFLDEGGGEAVIELVVDHEDLGKVIGRNGRVAHALRTLVRATAESPIAVDILDTNEAAESLDAAT